MPRSSDVVVGLDVGTSKVALVAGTIQDELIQVVGVGLAPNSGLRKGVVVDIDDTVSAISAAIEEAQRATDLPIRQAFVGAAGTQIAVNEAKGVVAVSRADGEIASADLERVMEAAQVAAAPPNREILHIIPRSFSVDGQKGIRDPIGLAGVRLEVEAQIISSQASTIRNLTKAVQQAGLALAELVFTPLASAKTMLSKKQREGGVALVDIGAGTTSIIVFEEGEMVHAAILPIGSLHFTNDLAIGLRIALDAAERLKIKYGTASKEQIKASELIPLSSFDPDEKEKIERGYLADIIEARLGELFGMVKDELKKIGKDGLLPAGVVLAGGGSKLTHLADFAKEYLHLPAQVANPLVEVSGLVDSLDDPSFAAAIGLMLWGMEDTELAPDRRPRLELHKVGGNLLERARHMFKQFLP